MYTLLMILGVGACLFWLVYIYFRTKQFKNTTLDKEPNQTAVRHPIRSNPVIISYVLALILVVVGAVIWISFTE